MTNKAVGIKTEHRYHTEGCTATPCPAGVGRYHLVSNPYRQAGESTAGWTRTKSDSMGRVVQVRSFNGDSVPAWTVEGDPSTTSGAVTTSYNQSHSAYSWVFTEVTDQQGKKRKTGYDAAGRVRAVIEDPNGLAYATTYDYTANGDLKRVTQGGQTRSFGVSSLGRLTWATNPESGTTHYSYDPNGNLVTRTSGGTVTTYGYDGLNRITQASYSDSTPAVTFCYDGKAGIGTNVGECNGSVPGSYQSGKLTEVRNSVSKKQYSSFDGVGRILNSAQVTNGQAYLFSYEYDHSGLRRMVYPSGRKVLYKMDEAGRTYSVQLEKNATEATELAYLLYAPHGGVTGRLMGNGVCQFVDINSRLQPYHVVVFRKTELYCSAGEYYSQQFWSYAPTGNPTGNNGNVMEHTVTHQLPQGEGWFRQEYAYDALNRLKSVKEFNPPQSAVRRMQTFVYDQYGNRALLVPESLPPVLGDAMGKATTATDTSAGAAAAFVNNRWTGAQHDMAGRMTQIGTPGMEGYRSFSYDAEGRITATTALQGGQTASATNAYDGEGKRVRKVRGSSDTVYVYDAFGSLAAEYGNTNPTGLGMSYYHRDRLGSTRLVTNAEGRLLRRIDYWPFGEEVSGLDRNNHAAYGGNVYPGPRDRVTEKFSGKERDAETGLDYFGARYLSAAQGRFTSADEPFADQYESDPQSWNLYSYGRNNPLRYIDPTGRKCIKTDGGSMADDGTGGGCEAAGVDPSGRIKSQKLEVQATAPPSPELLALALGMQRAAPAVNAAAVGTAVVMTGGFAGMGYGAIAGGAGLQQLGVAAGPAAYSLLPELGRKLDYLFGLARGSVHNIQRSTSMLSELQRVGLNDTAQARTYVQAHLGRVLNDASSIVSQTGGRTVRESFLMGPTGGVKLETVWEGTKLITMKVFGGGR